MERLSQQEAQELLQDAASIIRRNEFRMLKIEPNRLAPMEYLSFLNWAAHFMRESAEDRKLPSEKCMLL